MYLKIQINILIMVNKINKIVKVAVTGGICSGKSTITSFLSQQKHSYGISLDSYTDIVFRRNHFIHKILKEKLVAEGLNTKEIESIYPNKSNFNSESFNRKALGKVCFSNKDVLTLVKNLIVPEIIKIEEIKIKQIENCNLLLNEDDPNRIKFVFIEAPTVIESGRYKEYDELWSVIADAEIIESRFKERILKQNISEYNPEMLSKILNNQTNNERRKELSNVVIDTTDGRLEVNYNKSVIEYSKLIDRWKI